MPIPDLPLEVVSLISSLLAEPFYPPSDLSACSSSSSKLTGSLDPSPPPLQTICNLISSVSKASPRLLEASRPWLWENVDVRSGRGWLAVVNALTEEVIEDIPIADEKISSPIEGQLTPVSPESLPASDAHVQPNTVPGGTTQYISPPSPITYPYPRSTPQGMSITIPPSYYYSPPQPLRTDLLLTPPDTRNSSPNSNSASPPSVTTARLRGRSRSRRRNVGFDTEGISAVLSRSRSTSINTGRPGSADSWGRPPPIGRRSSLSLTRTRADLENETDENEGDEDGQEDLDEEEDEVMPLTSPRPQLLIPPVPEEERMNLNPELLPPPGPYIRHLSFVNFRTIGSRRTQDEAVRGRYVTAGRLEGVIKNAPNLISLCMTEYVDSSLSYTVLEELFFRGYRRPRRAQTLSLSRTRSLLIDPNPTFSPMTTSNQLDPPRPVYVPYETETETDMWRRRSVFTAVEALDLTGCVSKAFDDGMRQFYEDWLLDEAPDEAPDETMDGGRGRSRYRVDEADHAGRPRRMSNRPLRFSALRRLSLRACTSLDPPLMHALILSFPSLTHLDISGTAVPSTLLTSLTESCPRTLRLASLSLARCSRLAPSAVVDFLIRCPAARRLVDLNLFVNATSGSALTSDNVHRLITSAPCFNSGRLRYLDISGSGLLPSHLALETFPPQPSLVSLGLSYIPSLPLEPIADFLLELAPNVEILTLTGTALYSSLNPTYSSLQLTLKLHARLINPLTTIPFSLSSLNLNDGQSVDLRPGSTRLRVIELSSPVRHAISEGASTEWSVIKSKGGRGWYVDVSAGWVHDTGEWKFVRHLPRKHARRQWLQSLVEANGRVGSAVGWHSRKMEVGRGEGMMGREEGLAGVGAFAFEE